MTHNLSRWLESGPHSTEEVLNLGLSLLATLEGSQERNHDALSADSVVLGEGEEGLRVVSILPAKGPTAQAPERAGTLQAIPGLGAQLYEFGLLLFHALAGYPAFPVDLAPEALFDLQLRAKISLRLPALPKALASLVKRLLEPDPGSRYQSFQGVRHDLQRLAAGDEDFCVGQRDLRANLALPDFAGLPGEIESLFDRLLENRLLTVVGASGSGKSRLLRELAEMATARGWQILSLRGEPLTGTLLSSLAPLLERCLGLDACAVAAESVQQSLLPLVSQTAEPNQERLLSDALLEARLETLFRTLPLGLASAVLILADDAQWLGEPLLNALTHAPSEATLNVVIAARGLTPPRSTDVSLEALPSDVLSQLLESMAGPLPAKVTAQLVARSGGSPLLAVEGLRGWVEGGLLVASERGWQKQAGHDFGQTSVQAGTLLADRLDLLSPTDEQVLAASAVLSRAVMASAISQVTGVALDEVEAVVSRAQEQRLLWRSGADGQLAFCHDRIRHELEQRLNPTERLSLHLAAGHWWRDHAPKETYRQAYHYDQAGRADLARAPALMAARTARRTGDLRVEERSFRMALKAGPDPVCQRELAETLVARGVDFAEARRLLTESLQADTDSQERARIQSALASLEYRCNQPEKAMDHLRLAILQLGGPWPSQASLVPRILGQMLRHSWRQRFPNRLHSSPIQDTQRFELEVELYKRAAETGFELANIPFVIWSHFRLLNHTQRYTPTPQLGNLYSYHLALTASEFKRFDFPQRHWRAGLQALAHQGSPLQRGKAGVWLTMRHFLAGRFDRAERTARRTLLHLREAGDQWEAQILLGLLSNILYRQGRLDEAVEVAKTGYRGALRWNSDLAAARALRAWAQAAPREIPEELLREELDKAGSSAYRLFELYQAEAARLGGAGRYLEAVEALEKAIASGSQAKGFLALALPWKATWLRLAHDEAEGAQRVELLRRARRAARQALKLAQGRPPSLAHALRESALMAARRGNTAVARLQLAESLEVASKHKQERERALTLQARAQLGLALGWAGAAQDGEAARRVLEPAPLPDSPALKARFATLLETARVLLESPSQEQALLRAAEALRFMLRAEQAWVLVGPPEQARALCGQPPFNTETYRKSLRRGVTLVKAPEKDALLVRHGVSSALYVPLGGETALFLMHTRVRDLFRPEDIALCEFLARLTGTALDNHRVLGQLRDSEVHFRTLFENAGVGLQLISLEGRLLSENSFLKEHLALTGETDCSDPLSRLEADDSDRERILLQQLMQGERESYSLFLRHRRRSGASAWTQVTATLVRTASGQPAHIVRAISDFSTRHLQKVIAFGEQQHQLLALDLHDELAQRLALLGQKTYLGSPEEALAGVREELKYAVAEVRRLHRDLSSPSLSKRSYDKALRDYLLNFEAETRTSVEFRVSRQKGASWPRGLLGLFVYRIVQEALSNVRRHAQASSVVVRLRFGQQEIRGEVTDDGIGLTAPSGGRAHLGLAGIKLRCELSGGRCRVSSVPNEGTRLRFILPREGLH